MNLKNNDFIEVEVKVSTEDNEKIFDSNDKPKFIKQKILNSNSVLHVVGCNNYEFDFLLDKIINNLEIGIETEVKLPPEDAFGFPDKSLIKKYRLDNFDNWREIKVGDIISNDEDKSEMGVVKLIENGRITVDFNNRFVGKTIIIKAKTIKKIEDIGEKIQALIDNIVYLDLNKYEYKNKVNIYNLDLFSINFDKNNGILTLNIDNKIMYENMIYSILKITLLYYISLYITEINKINIIENYDTKQLLITQNINGW